MTKFTFKHLLELDLFFWIIILSIPAIIVGILFSNFGKNSQNSLSNQDPKFFTRTYIMDNDKMYFCKKIKGMIPKISTYGLSWNLVYSECNSSDGMQYVFKVEVPVVFFTDDLEIILIPSSDNKKMDVNVTSRSRVGKYDFGENRRHIVKIFEAMDRLFEEE